MALQMRWNTAALLLSAALMAGCGGGPEGAVMPPSAGPPAVSPASTVSSGRGSVSFSVQWPTEVQNRLIPSKSLSIKASLTNSSGVVTASTVIVKPATTATLQNVPSGSYTATAAAYPTSSGTGTAQAQASAPVNVIANQNNTVPLTLATTIDHFDFAQQNPTVLWGTPLTLTPTARDSSNNIVMTDPANLQWSSSGSAASVDANGKVTALGSGSVSITVIDTESGKSGSITVTASSGTALKSFQTFDFSAHGLLVDAAGNKLYATSSNEYGIIDLSTVALSSTDLPAPSGDISNSGAHTAALDPTGGAPLLWFVQDNSQVIGVAASSGNSVGSLTFNSPIAVAVDPTTRHVYVAFGNSPGNSGIATINEDSPVADPSPIQTTSGTLGDMAFDSSAHKLYLCSSTGIKMVDLSNGHVQTFTNSPGGGAAIAVNSTNHLVYQANSAGASTPGTLSILDPSTGNVSTANIGKNPLNVAANTTTGYVYVVNLYSNDVSVVSPTNSVTSVPLKDPNGNLYTPDGGLSYNPSTNQIYVGATFNGRAAIAILDGSAPAR